MSYDAARSYVTLNKGRAMHLDSCSDVLTYDGDLRDGTTRHTRSQARRWLAADARRRPCLHCSPGALIGPVLRLVADVSRGTS